MHNGIGTGAKGQSGNVKKQRTGQTVRRSTPKPRTRARQSQKQLEGMLQQLLRAELIRPADENEPAYMFKHALVQDTVHATLLKNENKRLHLLVAHALEERNADRLDEYAAALAHHFAEAEDDAKTLEYSIRAGDIAARVFANDEGLAHYNRAIGIAHRDHTATATQIIHLYQQRGRILEVTGKYTEALASYQGLQELAQTRRERALELASLMLRAPLHSAPLPTFDAQLAKQLLLDALGTARELCDQVAEARVLWNLTLLSVHTMHPADGIMYGELSLGLAEKLNLREQRAYTLHDLFIPYRSVGQIERARAVQVQARDLFRELDDKPMLADSLGMSAQFAMYEGNLKDALTFATEGQAISRTVGNPFGIFFNGAFLSNIYLERGDSIQAFEVIQDQIEGLRRGTLPFNAVWVAAVIGLFTAQIGAVELSQEMESYARGLSAKPIPPMFQNGLAALLGRIEVLRGNAAEAAQDLARATPAIELGGALQPGAIHMPLAQAELALLLGKYQEAIVFLRPQAEWAVTNQYRMLLPENLLAQAHAFNALDDLKNAAGVLQQAYEYADAIGMPRLLWQILAMLCRVERKRGNTNASETYQKRARKILEYIIAHTPDELRDNFVNLPSVREVLA